MEKYVAVIDEDGSFLEATYPRRARGLVKKGRARFVDEEETTICLIKEEDNDTLQNVTNEETQSCLSDIYYNYFIKLSEDTLMSDLNNNNNNINDNIDDIEKKIDSEIDKLVNDAINEAMVDSQDSENADGAKKEVDTDELLKAIKAGLKESLGAANILAKKGYDSAKSGIKDMANSVKDMFANMQEAAKEAKEEFENEESCECDESDESCECDVCQDESQCECEDEKKKEKKKEVKFDFKFDHKDGKFEGKFGPKEFKFDAKDFKFQPPHFKGDRKPDSYSLTMDFITSRIDMVINNMSHLMEAVDAAKNMQLSADGSNGDAERAKAIKSTVELREQTNREIIALLNKMYEDLMAPVRADRKDPKDAALDAHIARILENDMNADEKIELINAISQIYK